MKKSKKTLEQVMTEQYDLLCRSIARYGKSNLLEEMNFIRPDNNGLNMLNPYSLKVFADIFCQRFYDLTLCKSDVRVLSATLIDDEFDFGSKKGKFKVNKAKRKFKEILNGLDYIGNVTFAMYRNEKKSLDEGYLRSVHCHFLLLSPISRKRREEISSLVHMDENKGIPLYIKEYSLQEAVEYIWHAPFPAYASIPNKNKCTVEQMKVKPTLKSLYGLYINYKPSKIYDWTIAGGKGLEVWNSIKDELEASIEESEDA